jgi:hypothetical protein
MGVEKIKYVNVSIRVDTFFLTLYNVVGTEWYRLHGLRECRK